jgi:5'-3' exonuclease
MAIDGVTPRARMTHQRTNRFLKSKNIPDGIKENFLTDDRHQATTTETFDECNIKPGTVFMSKLSKRLQSYICDRMSTKKTWGSLKIILSGANVPGEGEHKIISFIRQQCIQPDYNPKTYHVVYSSDSDLVLLGLLTHERNFTIICEKCDNCADIGHGVKDCKTNKNSQNNKSLTTTNIAEKKYVVIDLSKLSDRLKIDFQNTVSLSFQSEPERFIDDWVFICLLFGNDFLPRSQSIKFFGNYITMYDLIYVYKKNVGTKGYLTKNATINMNRLVIFLKEVGEKDKDGKLRCPPYYKDKFYVNEAQLKTFSTKVATDYVRGLCWVFQYYYQGPPSWNWYGFFYRLTQLKISLFLLCFRYYPHYYAPLVYDFLNLKNAPLNFDQDTKPFSPLEQMIATFSPQNAKYLPSEWQPLMVKKESPIFEFYPPSFSVDPNGKRTRSLYVALLPFIDEKRLLEALEPVYSTLTPEEKKRNTLGYDCLFIHRRNLLDKKLEVLCGNDAKKITENNPLKIQDICLDGRVVGDVWPDDNDNIIDGEEDEKALQSNCTDISNNEVICFKYRNPTKSIEKDVHNSVHLQTTSNQFNPDSTVQLQQQQALSSKPIHKPFQWGKHS